MKCSVIIPCYNQAAYLTVAVESVINQTYKNYEIIIVIDGSPDNAFEVASALAQKSDLIKVYKKENGGLASARNYGVERSTGEVILPLDADDKIAPTYLEKGMRYFEGNKNDFIVYCNAEYFGFQTGPWKLDPFNVSELCLYNMIFCSAFYRKSTWLKVGGYDSNVKSAWSDWEFWLSLVQHGCEVVKIEEVLFYYHIKPNSMLTSMTKDEEYKGFDYIWQKHKFFIANHIHNPLIINYESYVLREELNDLRRSKALRIVAGIKKLASALGFKK